MLITSERATEIANLYYDDIYHYCLSRLRNEENAADIAQEVFLVFQEKYGDLNDDYIRAWLYAVANNKIKEQFRAIAKREKEILLSEILGKQTSADIIYEMQDDNLITDEELEEKKKGILASLTEKELELFEMIYTKRMEYKELAEALGVSESTARTRVCRLKLKIKEKASFIFMAILLIFMKF